MNEEELDSIQELIERKLLMAEVMGGLTSHDKKFIDLWNYTIQLQNNWNELKNYLEKQIIDSKSASSQQYYFNTIYKFMQELEQGKDD